MPLTPKSFQDVYNIIRTKIEETYPNADFNEGSFNDIYAGSFALAYQELQAYALEQFRKTFFLNPSNTGTDLETLAVDHFHEGAQRPQAQKAVGTVTVTRESGNTDQIDIAQGTVFSSNEKDYVSTEVVTILAGNDNGNVTLEAVEAGQAGNLLANQSWKTSINAVTVANAEPFQGGADQLDDQQYREFIQSFVESIQDGTAIGLEGTAKLVPGVSSAKVIRKLVDVGTLTPAGILKTSDLVRFKTVNLILYVAGETTATNSAIRSVVETMVKEQLSAGETISVQSATPKSIDWSVTLTFTSSSQALAVSKQRSQIKTAFENAINDLDIGSDFDRTAMATKVLSDNNWTGLFTIVTNTPSGNITIKENEKAYAGTVTVTYA